MVSGTRVWLACGESERSVGVQCEGNVFPRKRQIPSHFVDGMRTQVLPFGQNTGSKPRFAAIKNAPLDLRGAFFMAAELGFEPRHTESESAVLPLHNSAIAFQA